MIKFSVLMARKVLELSGPDAVNLFNRFKQLTLWEFSVSLRHFSNGGDHIRIYFTQVAISGTVLNEL